jgi:hypothetical protein
LVVYLSPGDSIVINMASARKHTWVNIDLKNIPFYSNPERIFTLRNIREREESFSSSNPQLTVFPLYGYQVNEKLSLQDTPKEINYFVMFSNHPLIDFQASPL